MNRRRALLSLGAGLVCGWKLDSGLCASEAASEPARAGRNFLASLFDPELNLLPEYRGAKTYWLYHDNYLAAKVLASSHPDLAEKIKKSMLAEGISQSGKIEMLFGEAREPLPFRQYKLQEVRRTQEKIIKTELVEGGPMKGWEEYADLLLLAAIYRAETHPAGARRLFEAAMASWDGRGLRDRAARNLGMYATYKLALAIRAASVLKLSSYVLPAVREKLLAQQNEEGGWITDYNVDGKRLGLANVETTSLAILALESQIPKDNPHI